MISLQNTHLVINIITLIISYTVLAVLVGCFHAWIIQKMGDSTAVDYGYFTLNPAQHIDPIGMIVLIFLGIGWGRKIPIDPNNIYGKYVHLRRFIAYFAGVFLHIILALLAYVILFHVLDKSITHIISPMILHRESFLSTTNLCALYPGHSSTAISGAFVLMVFMYINILLATIHSITAACDLAMLEIAEESPDWHEYLGYFDFAIPLLLLFLVGGPIRKIILKTILIIGYIYSCLLNMQ